MLQFRGASKRFLWIASSKCSNNSQCKFNYPIFKLQKAELWFAFKTHKRRANWPKSQLEAKLMKKCQALALIRAKLFEIFKLKLCGRRESEKQKKNKRKKVKNMQNKHFKVFSASHSRFERCTVKVTFQKWLINYHNELHLKSCNCSNTSLKMEVGFKKTMKKGGTLENDVPSCLEISSARSLATPCKECAIYLLCSSIQQSCIGSKYLYKT